MCDSVCVRACACRVARVCIFQLYYLHVNIIYAILKGNTMLCVILCTLHDGIVNFPIAGSTYCIAL